MSREPACGARESGARTWRTVTVRGCWPRQINEGGGSSPKGVRWNTGSTWQNTSTGSTVGSVRGAGSGERGAWTDEGSQRAP